MIIVMGLPGAGKSTVLAVAKDMGWEVLNYGDLMMELASFEGITDRDMLRKLPLAKQKTIQQKVGHQLASKRGNVILDTHCSINTPGGYLPGLPKIVLEQLMHVDRLVLVTAPVSDILGRREKDKTRVRDDQTAEGLQEHEAMNRAYLAAYSVLTGAPAVIIVNADGRLEQTKKEFAALLQ